MTGSIAADGGTPLARAHFPATQRWTYLNHAGICPLPQPSVDAMHRRATEVSLDGEFSYAAHSAEIERVRAAAARLLGVPGTDVAFVKNTTTGLGMIANGLDWSPGDRVVVPDLEFPSTLYPWLALADRGVVVDRVRPVGPGGKLPVEAFAERIQAGPPPKLVVTSWVQFGRGWRVDLAELGRVCRAAGALLCADVIQGLGVIPAELARWGVDFAMADGHKWLLGPEGSGVLYVRGSRLELLRPLEPGWNSVAHREDWDNLELVFDDTARRLEGGMPNVTGIAALGASIELLLAAGIDAIWAHVDRLCEQACAELTAIGATVLTDRSPEGRSGIVSVHLDGAPIPLLASRLQAAGIAVSARAGGLRVSPHGYNTTQDIDHLVRTLATLIRS
ncbi:putative cysteine desulfurase [Nocardia brasiliensis NBRC 14402]|uniref:aminotransferase class V-fold PLP-dependent enzyme n=1 Tax=Nocardia brasiliensis TaxID=37326 RepID=UPI0002F3DB4E|nr:aminotransferase class V-fold PLP-dependent enzyme [Nocardia brasiliensis]ASF08372.1 aminotransferase class V-fold PLP-dependent enzyme [Nocardia brasiliensis]GAJ85615.1 putative cysteine desulfurase [Nocardia brasiliensis NBRC 14402]SUB41160.1 Cysteine desulfurase [Nocardia brasiliensis]